MNEFMRRPYELGLGLLVSWRLAKAKPVTGKELYDLGRELESRIGEAAAAVPADSTGSGWSIEEHIEQRSLGAALDLLLEKMFPLPIQTPTVPPGSSFLVCVADNFDPSATAHTDSVHDDSLLAVERCKRIVDQWLTANHRPGICTRDLYESFKLFGDDPYIVGPNAPKFSAWNYAWERAGILCAADGAHS